MASIFKVTSWPKMASGAPSILQTSGKREREPKRETLPRSNPFEVTFLKISHISTYILLGRIESRSHIEWQVSLGTIVFHLGALPPRMKAVGR